MSRPGARDGIDAHATVGGRHAPFGLDEAVLEQSLKGGVERAFFHLEEVTRRLLNTLDERVAVQRLLFQQPEHHHLESAGEKVARLYVGHGTCLLKA